MSNEADERTFEPLKFEETPWKRTLLAVYALISIPICICVSGSVGMISAGDPDLELVLADKIIAYSVFLFGPMMMMAALISVLIYSKTGRFKLASVFLLLPLVNVVIILLAYPFSKFTWL